MDVLVAGLQDPSPTSGMEAFRARRRYIQLSTLAPSGKGSLADLQDHPILEVGFFDPHGYL